MGKDLPSLTFLGYKFYYFIIQLHFFVSVFQTQFGDHQPLMAYFIKERKMFVVILVIKNPNGSFDTFLRLSGQIYTTLDDFNKVGEEIHKLSKEEI